MSIVFGKKFSGSARKKWFKGFSPVEKKGWKVLIRLAIQTLPLLTEKLNCQETEVIR
jgi:hypothetical protein